MEYQRKDLFCEPFVPLGRKIYEAARPLLLSIFSIWAKITALQIECQEAGFSHTNCLIPRCTSKRFVKTSLSCPRLVSLTVITTGRKYNPTTVLKGRIRQSSSRYFISNLCQQGACFMLWVYDICYISSLFYPKIKSLYCFAMSSIGLSGQAHHIYASPSVPPSRPSNPTQRRQRCHHSSVPVPNTLKSLFTVQMHVTSHALPQPRSSW
jgi:hypothetical protein